MGIGFDTRDALCTLTCEGLADDALLVTHWAGEESISRPYRFTLTVACPDLGLDIGRMIGRNATLSIGEATTPRRWHGVVTSVRDAGFGEDHALAIVELEPSLALLRRFRRSDVYLGKTIADIIRTTLAQAGLTSEGPAEDDGTDCHFVIRMPESRVAPTKLGFVCQFEETTLDFLSRRLEREGVYYWFEPRGRGEAVVFGDATDLQPQAATPLVWRPDATRIAEDNHQALVQFQRDLGMSPARVRLDNFAASRADLDLEVTAAPRLTGVAQADARHDPPGEIGVYGEHYSTHADGERLASVRAQALACQTDRYHGESRAPGLRAGGFAQVQEHVRMAYDGRYAIVNVRHEGSQPLPGAGEDDAVSANYRNQFVAIDAQRQYRTDRRTRWPRVIGLVSALIDSESDGTYAELDENGCYRVRFPFADTDYQASHNSAPVRMATPYAGDGHGMHLPLLKGTEVLVSFVGGDPDRPIILGAVPNSEHPNMLDGESASRPGLRTAGGNALAFEDRDGKQSALLGSPVGDSHIAIGSGTGNAAGKSGISMRTQNHVDMASTSFQHSVPGIFLQRIIPAGLAKSDTNSSTTDDTLGSTHDDKDKKDKDDKEDKTDHEEGAHLESESEGEELLSPTWWGGYGQVKTELGIMVTNTWGAEFKTTFGTSTDVTIGNTNEFKLAFGFEFSKDKMWTVHNKHLQEKLEEDVNIVKVSHTVGNKTEKILQKTETVGEYKGTVTTTYDLKSLVSYSLASPSITLDDGLTTASIGIKPAQISVLSDGSLKAYGERVTQVGTFLGSTNVEGSTLYLGDMILATETILAGQQVKLEFGAMGSIEGEGPLSLEGGLIRIG